MHRRKVRRPPAKPVFRHRAGCTDRRGVRKRHLSGGMEPHPPHEPADYFYAFLARITRNLSLNRCRERSRLKRQGHICRLTSELEQCLPAPDNAAGRMDDLAFSQVINGFLAALPSEKRIIFLRRYWYLDSVADIANRCGLSRSKVKTTLYRCREQLRSYLEKEGYPL